jgi:deoxyribonuclease-4
VKIGAHQSIAGGLERAIESARRDGCEAVQVFTRNQSQWKAKPLTDEAVERFRAAFAAWGVPRQRLIAHDSYLINVCARDRTLRRKSLRALIEELERCARLGIPYLVMHPGAHVGQGEERALALVARAVSEALERTADAPEPASLLIENTAGQGTNLGYRFEHLRDLLAGIAPRDRVGVCIDTQHTWAAGYDLSTPERYEATFKEMDRVFGLENVRAFHINDSKRELGCRVDRHERIGEGWIGRTCFRLLVNDRRFADLPGVLELPPPYPPLLQRLRRMSDGEATARRRPPAPRSGRSPGRRTTRRR